MWFSSLIKALVRCMYSRHFFPYTCNFAGVLEGHTQQQAARQGSLVVAIHGIEWASDVVRTQFIDINRYLFRLSCQSIFRYNKDLQKSLGSYHFWVDTMWTGSSLYGMNKVGVIIIRNGTHSMVCWRRWWIREEIGRSWEPHQWKIVVSVEPMLYYTGGLWEQWNIANAKGEWLEKS